MKNICVSDLNKSAILFIVGIFGIMWVLKRSEDPNHNPYLLGVPLMIFIIILGVAALLLIWGLTKKE